MEVMQECVVKEIKFKNQKEFELYFDKLQDSGCPFRRIVESHSVVRDEVSAVVVYADDKSRDLLSQRYCGFCLVGG